MPYRPLASEVLYIAKRAGEVILFYYAKGDIEVENKADNSPVTVADKAANKLITLALSELTPDIPIVSEEDDASFANNFDPDNHLFWLVDPLDGTKSFIKRKGEFTVNIALIENGVPVGGVVYIPTIDSAYFTAEDGNAYKQVKKNLPDPIRTRRIPQSGAVIVSSKSHMDEDTTAFIQQQKKVYQTISAASSLKFCLVAEGAADIYPRFAPTMEWDTAAGQAVLEAAGGYMVNPHTNKPFRYNKSGFRNTNFLATGEVAGA
jgi:3'(2'), 5'-bisphosphate nucleotidase